MAVPDLKVDIPDDLFSQMAAAGGVKLTARHRARCRKILTEYWMVYRMILAAPESKEKHRLYELVGAINAMASLLSKGERRLAGQLFIDAKVDVGDEMGRLKSLLLASVPMAERLSAGGAPNKAIGPLLLEPLHAVFLQAGGGTKIEDFIAFAWPAVDRCFPRHVANAGGLKRSWRRYRKNPTGK